MAAMIGIAFRAGKPSGGGMRLSSALMGSPSSSSMVSQSRAFSAMAVKDQPFRRSGWERDDGCRMAARYATFRLYRRPQPIATKPMITNSAVGGSGMTAAAESLPSTS